MIRSLLCMTTLSLLAQGPPPAKSKIADLPVLPTPTSSPVKELVRADLNPAEIESPEALAASLYAFISGPKGQKRDIERIRALFHLQARVMLAFRHPQSGVFLRPMELEGFLAFALPQWEKTGFFERQTTLVVQKKDALAQVWSTYEIRLTADGPAMYTGVNALQCAWDGKRWWITHLEFQNAPTPALEASLDGGKKAAGEEPKKVEPKKAE